MQNYPKSNLNKVVRGAKRATYNVQELNNILDAGFIGYVSFIYDDRAISLPMAYGRSGSSIYLHGSLKNRMFSTLIESKKVSMTVMHLDGLVLARSAFHHSANYRSATIFGDLSIVDEEAAKTKALKCIIDHMIPGRWEHLRPISQKDIKSTLVVKIDIQTASAKIRNERVVDEKEDLDYPVWAGVVPVKQVAQRPQSDPLLSPDIDIPDHAMEYYNKNK